MPTSRSNSIGGSDAGACNMAGAQREDRRPELHSVPRVLQDPRVRTFGRLDLPVLLSSSVQAGAGGAQVRRVQRVSLRALYSFLKTADASRRNYQPPVVERVDHLTGAREEFLYCSRHTPPAAFLQECMTARELRAWQPPRSKH